MSAEYTPGRPGHLPSREGERTQEQPEREPGRDRPRDQERPEEPSDEELDRFILARLRLAGVDLSVLPDDDPEAPADQKRVLAAARTFLRSTPRRIAELELDPLGAPPTMYPAELSVWIDAEG